MTVNLKNRINELFGAILPGGSTIEWQDFDPDGGGSAFGYKTILPGIELQIEVQIDDPGFRILPTLCHSDSELIPFWEFNLERITWDEIDDQSAFTEAVRDVRDGVSGELTSFAEAITNFVEAMPDLGP